MTKEEYMYDVPYILYNGEQVRTQLPISFEGILGHVKAFVLAIVFGLFRGRQAGIQQF